ncbi:MAG TPA: hypothetical protein VGH96_02960, partial [Streptosporangiaceae bacterium]
AARHGRTVTKDWFTATMDEPRDQLASVGAQATGPHRACSREPFIEPRGLTTLYIRARAHGARHRRPLPRHRPDRASGRTEIAWPVLRLAG